jgi:hypothetical protein
MLVQRRRTTSTGRWARRWWRRPGGAGRGYRGRCRGRATAPRQGRRTPMDPVVDSVPSPSTCKTHEDIRFWLPRHVVPSVTIGTTASGGCSWPLTSCLTDLP